MRAGFAVWRERISPVFDVSRNILIVDFDDQQIASRQLITLPDNAVYKIELLKQMEIQTLICGAVSQDLAMIVNTYGIKIIPFVAGDIEEVIAAYIHQDLPNAQLTMPGCGAKRKQCRKRRGKQSKGRSN